MKRERKREREREIDRERERVIDSDRTDLFYGGDREFSSLREWL